MSAAVPRAPCSTTTSGAPAAADAAWCTIAVRSPSACTVTVRVPERAGGAARAAAAAQPDEARTSRAVSGAAAVRCRARPATRAKRRTAPCWPARPLVPIPQPGRDRMADEESPRSGVIGPQTVGGAT